MRGDVDSTQPTVLVVDDEERNLQVVAATLSTIGYGVMLAASGAAALERLATRMPDIILLDINMPEMDGFALCDRLKSSPETAAIPVIFLSADDDKNVIVRALEAGGVDYVTKPFNKAELIARLRTHIDLKRARERVDDLLGMILPANIRDRLKAGEQDIVDTYEHASVIFADIAGFTDLSSKGDPAAIAAWLGDVFSRADQLALDHKVQRIKTIGDAYLAVAGISGAGGDDCLAAARFALDLAAQLDAGFRGEPPAWHIGVHSGPLVAGVVGRTQFSFDIWGDTVNIAHRVQESAAPGTVRISAQTRDRLNASSAGEFKFTDARSLAFPNHDDLPTFLLSTNS